MERAHQVGAVVHGDVGPVRECGAHVLVVRRMILALDCEHLDSVIAHQVGRHIVLRGEGVRCTQSDVCSPRFQRDREVGGFRGDVETGRETLPRERALAAEPLLELPQHGHRALGPFGAAAPFISEVEILDVVRRGLRGRGHRAAVRDS